ncbi:MAG: cysteine-rich CWC family protein [Pseudomonadota bacterium]
MNRPAALPPDASTQTCESCGNAMRCGMNAGDAQCWCTALPKLDPATLRRPDGTPWSACLCPDCLGRLAAAQTDVG